MRKTFLLLLLGFAIIGCKDNPVSQKISEAKKEVTGVTKAMKEMHDMKGDIEGLAEVEPLSNEELKALLPEQIGGLTRTGFHTGEGAMLGVASINGSYATEDQEKSVTINIIDGAGATGASVLVGIRMMLLQDFEKEDQYVSEKTITRKGVKAIVEKDKTSPGSRIKYLHDNRFFVDAEGHGVEADELWTILDRLKF